VRIFSEEYANITLFVFSLLLIFCFDTYRVNKYYKENNKNVDSLEQIIFYQNIEINHYQIFLDNLKEIDSNLYIKIITNIE
jgi:hypothetical protein